MAPGSVLVTFGQTKVLCTASVEERVPPWMRGTGRGWVTAEYSMLPGSTPERASREAAKGKQSGRTQEIQRLIAAACGPCATWSPSARCRSPSTATPAGRRRDTDFASICGAYVALHDACTRLVQAGTIRTHPLTDSVAAVSVGIMGADARPPLCRGPAAEYDMNVVMTGAGRYVEVQGTAEGMAFSRSELDGLLGLAEAGIKELTDLQATVLASPRRDGERGRPAPLVLASPTPQLKRSRPSLAAVRVPLVRARPVCATWSRPVRR